MKIDRADIRVLSGIILVVVSAATLWGLSGVAAVALVLGVLLLITGALEG